MPLEAYKPHMHDLLSSALAEEGLTPEEMTFETDYCCLLKDEDGPVGFFSFRFEETIRLIHFLVFQNRRSIKNAVSLYRHFLALALASGKAAFIAEVSDERKHLLNGLRYWAGDELKELGKRGKDTFYLVPVSRRRAAA